MYAAEKKTAFRIATVLEYVTPLLEHSSVMWSPQTKCDITDIENVQRHFTKRFPELRNLSYKERLSKLNLVRLELCRLQFDLIMCHKRLSSIIILLFYYYYFVILLFYYYYVAARRHICFCFMAKSAFWRGFSALAPYTGVGPI